MFCRGSRRKGRFVFGLFRLLRRWTRRRRRPALDTAGVVEQAGLWRVVARVRDEPVVQYDEGRVAAAELAVVIHRHEAHAQSRRPVGLQSDVLVQRRIHHLSRNGAFKRAPRKFQRFFPHATVHEPLTYGASKFASTFSRETQRAAPFARRLPLVLLSQSAFSWTSTSIDSCFTISQLTVRCCLPVVVFSYFSRWLSRSACRERRRAGRASGREKKREKREKTKEATN